VRANRIVASDPGWQLAHHRLGIRSRADANLITLDGANERLSYAVTLRTFDRRGSRFKTDVSGKAAGIASAAVVRHPLDDVRQTIAPAEPAFFGGDGGSRNFFEPAACSSASS
jgi:hypothetical protein